MLRPAAIVICFLCILYDLSSQELPPLKSFYPQTYNGGDQNWDVTQDDNKIIYVANNKGLLSYNGSQWDLSLSPNQSIMRSVLAVNNRILSGQYRDFGFWKRNAYGELEYTSLLNKFKITPLEDEEFWGIAAIGDWLMFQSLDRIYILNEKLNRINIIESETTLTEMVVVDNTIVFQKIDQGIFKIENGEEQLITDHELIQSEILVNAYKENGKWFFLTQNSGLFEFEGEEVTKASNNLNSKIGNRSIYSAIHLSNNYYALGSISNGLLLFDDKDELKYEVNQSNGLSNNTVLAVFEDADGNIWLAMDNGISLINLSSEFRVYYDQEGILGTVYTAINYESILYLGTNQGLFYKDDRQRFTMVQGTEGQVWSLDLIDDTLFCGHDRGTFIVNKDKTASLISSIQGTWKVKQHPKDPSLLFQGNYNGLYIFEKVNNGWKLRNKLNGFDTSARYFEFVTPNTIVLSHEYKGIFYITVDKEFKSIVSIEKDELKESVNSSLTSYRNNIYYGGESGIYKYDTALGLFHFDSISSQLTNYSPYVSGKLITTDNDQKLWYASQEGFSYSQPDNLTGDFTINTIALPLKVRATKSGYEHIFKISDYQYLLGTTEGYLIITINDNQKLTPTVRLDNLKNSVTGEPYKLVDILNQSNFENESNSFVFSYYAPSYDIFTQPEFRYRLKGYVDEWSSWSSSSFTSFENLPYGSYTFEVQSKTGDIQSTITADYSFKVNKPWYLTPMAFLGYFLLIAIVIVITHSIYRGYYKRQRTRLLISKEKEIEFKELEAQQQIMQFRNENLQLDVENKSRELGLSTMNLIQKNELLNDIKNQLNKVKSLQDVKGVVRLINRQLNTSADWKVFEEAFNNADKEFLKNIKSKHPNLTSNDLRLCAYLRLNLSSKEIAPLLNISHKSVEVKRYRLRKKMDLEHQINLTDYILQI